MQDSIDHLTLKTHFISVILQQNVKMSPLKNNTFL